MLITTKYFGNIEIDEKKIILFKEGIPGLDEYKKYVLIDVEDSNLKCLQSIEESNIAFMVINPWDYFDKYDIELSDIEIEQLEISAEEDIVVYNIVNFRDNKITVNLLAPLIININHNIAKQVILNEKKYSLRQEIPCLFYQGK